MDRSEILFLVGESHEQDDNGVFQTAMTERMVFCQAQSVTRNEFFEGGRNGLNPEYEFTMFAGDYRGERICKYQGNRYAIYRVYRGRNDTIELYVQREGGTNGEGDNARETVC